MVTICDHLLKSDGDNMAKQRSVIRVGTIQQRILLIRGEKVIVDADLAEAYGVTTKALNQAIRRNLHRFPEDFMFQLTKQEKLEVVTNCDHLQKLKYSPVNPRVFTEHGAIMAASVLNSPKAVEVSVFVVRAFVQLREVIAGHIRSWRARSRNSSVSWAITTTKSWSWLRLSSSSWIPSFHQNPDVLDSAQNDPNQGLHKYFSFRARNEKTVNPVVRMTYSC